MALANMLVDVITRGIDAFRMKGTDCKKCHLRRSNAMYKPRRPTVKTVVVSGGCARARRRFFNRKCMDKKRLLDPIDREDVVVTHVIRNTAVHSRSVEAGENMEGISIATVPWILKWKYRKIHPELQQIDGGFFEKFGSQLEEHSKVATAEEQLEQERAAEDAAKTISSIPEGDENAEDGDQGKNTCSAEGAEATTDFEIVFASSDSEEDDKSATGHYMALAWNIDELYSELLYEIIHNVGCDATCEIGQGELFLYLQDAFKMSNQRHQELYDEAEQREAPKLMLNVEVIEAKDLKPKDSNGLSDPFVTLFLLSNSAHRYNTSVKLNTLSPVWEEHFPLPILNNTDDILCMEVWDFDPAETVKEKMGKFFDIKGIKGVRKFMKEIALTATVGQHDNELIGTAKIPINTIPASGMTMWYSLDKKNKMSRQGVIKVRLAFSSKKNGQVSAQEHKQLLRILLLHELEDSKVAQYWWSGTFSGRANALLTQHIAQSGLQSVDVALAQWTVYAAVHQNHPLSFTLFANLLEKLMKPLQATVISEEDRKMFWDATRKLLPSLYSVIRKIRRKCTNEKATIKQLIEVLRILAKIDSLGVPEEMDLFPARLYPWIKILESDWDINSVLREAVMHSTNDWFNHIIENNARQDESEIGQLQYLIKITQLVRTDLQKAIELYDKIFKDNARFPYAKTLYTVYQAEIATLSEPDVTDICKSLKRLSYVGFSPSEENSTEPLSVGTSLFELYLILQRFVMLGTSLCPGEFETFHIRNFHGWFYGGVAQWLDIAVYKALTRIEKAVELDTLLPVDSTVKYSSSAVDTLTIFYQIKVFWQQLNWPDVEGSYTFIAKIIDDICKCSVYYADKMSERVDGMGDTQNVYEKKFEVTREWCLAINNIDYVRQSLRPFTEELGKDDVLLQLSEMKSEMEADRCKQTLDNVILNAIDTVKNKIIELLETVVNKMCPSMRRLLVEGAELYQQDSNSIDRVMMYVDNNLATLHAELNEDNFNKTLMIIWDNVSSILNELLQTNLEKRRPPTFFANLHEMLNIMLKSFKSSDNCSCEELKRIERLLKLNGMETAALVHQVHLDLLDEQNNLKESPYGQLTVRMKFHNSDLHVEIMNARNLIAMDSNGACDAFVRIHLLPEEKFLGVTKPKTQTHSKNRFPLFDEKFEIVMSMEQQNVQDGILLFSVKDYDLLGYNNQYIGEALVHFKDIPTVTEPLASLEQVSLELMRPSTLKTDAIEALEYRQGDKQAKEFLKKFKQRMGTNGTN